MKIKLYKYQGAGNDFIVVDNRTDRYNLTTEQIAKLCDRRYGVGGDGFIYLRSSDKLDFAMQYFNADGKEGTFCGNGGRCLIAFAARMGIKSYHFDAADSPHLGKVIEYTPFSSMIELSMGDLSKIKKHSPKSLFLNTGSPHLVLFIDNLDSHDVDSAGKLWRHHPSFVGGTNVNFVQGNWGRDSSKWSRSLEEGAPLELSVRTYERGVEAETLSCGTGVVASAIAYHKLLTAPSPYLRRRDGASQKRIIAKVKTLGGVLEVEFNYNGGESYSHIILRGEATYVFESEVDINI
ncbi:MAG: diaminopimelate epimerase [Bacteroidales bacterium]